MGLSSNGNVWNTCLRILRQRGYELRVEGDVDSEGSVIPETCHWIAEKDDFYFCGDNPIELLGLTAVHDFVQPTNDDSYWWVVDGENIWMELYDKAFPDDAQ